MTEIINDWNLMTTFGRCFVIVMLIAMVTLLTIFHKEIK